MKDRWPWFVLLAALLLLSFAVLRMTLIPVTGSEPLTPNLHCPVPLRALHLQQRPPYCDHPLGVALVESVLAALAGIAALVVFAVAALTSERRFRRS